MIPSDVYRLLAGALEPALRSQGFRRVESPMLSWHERVGEQYLVVWCQHSSEAWSSTAGGRFVVELQLSDDPVPGSDTGVRARLGLDLLDGAAVAQGQRLRAGVMAALGITSADPNYDTDHQLWFRYATASDVLIAAEFLVEHFPGAIRRFQTRAVAQRDPTSHDPLLTHDVVRAQREICARYGAEWAPTPSHLKVGVAQNLKTPLQPVYGMRHLGTEDTAGWFLFAGDPDDPETRADDFYSPLHAGHLIEWRPMIIPFLGLAHGWAFVTDGSYVDVWQDPALLEP